MTEQLFKQVTNDDGSVCYVPVESDEKVERWKPSLGGGYFFVSAEGVRIKTIWANDALDNKRYEHGNCFQYEKDAIHMSEYQRISNYIYIACKMVEPDYEFVPGAFNYHVAPKGNKWDYSAAPVFQHTSPAYVSSHENAEKVIALLESWEVL